MSTKRILQFIAPFAVVIIIVIAVWNVLTHGQIEHAGKSVYKNRCASCHGENGEGTKALIPPIDNADYAAKNFDSIPCWLTNGLYHPVVVNGKSYDQYMFPPAGMDDVQIANVMNYMAKEYFHIDREVNSQWVREQLKHCK